MQKIYTLALWSSLFQLGYFYLSLGRLRSLLPFTRISNFMFQSFSPIGLKFWTFFLPNFFLCSFEWSSFDYSGKDIHGLVAYLVSICSSSSLLQKEPSFFFVVFRVTMWKSAGATSWSISHPLTFSCSYRQFWPMKSKWNSTVIISGNIWFPDKWDIYSWDPPSCSGVSNQQNSIKFQENLLITLHCERISLWEILGSVS